MPSVSVCRKKCKWTQVVVVLGVESASHVKACSVVTGGGGWANHLHARTPTQQRKYSSAVIFSSHQLRRPRSLP